MPLLLLSLFSCFQKKKQPENLKTWLEAQFPGKMTVVGNIVDLDPKKLFDRKTSTIVADVQDPEVQIRITWHKGQEELGISREDVSSSLEQARKDVHTARKLFQLLKEAGLDTFSVGVIDMAVYVLLYEGPTPELRESSATGILHVLHSMPDMMQTSFWVEAMEPSAYQQEFKDIVPFGYWQRGDSYHVSHTIMSLDFEYNSDLQAEHLLARWKINTESSRLKEYQQMSFKAASAWAEQHVKKPFHLEDSFYRTERDEDQPLCIWFDFPYFNTKPDTGQSPADAEGDVVGYVSGLYDTQSRTFSRVNITKE